MKCTVKLLVWTAFFLCLSAGAQEPPREDTAMVNALLQKSKELFSTDQAAALKHAFDAKAMAERIGFQEGVAYALKNVGLVYSMQGKYVETLEYWQQSLKVFESISDDVGVSNMLNNFGVIYYYQGDNIKALDYYLQSLKIAERTGDKLRILTALNNVGGIYGLKKATYEKALHYYMKALPLCEELGDKQALGAISVNVGDIYFQNNDDEKALFYFNKALKVYGNSEGAPNAYNAIGKLYVKEGKYDLALSNHSRALSISEGGGDMLNTVQSLMGLATVYVKKDAYKSALQYYKRAEGPAVDLKANNILMDLYRDMATAYAKTSDYGNAFRYQSLYSTVKDEQYNIETDKKLTSMQFDFDLQKKQGEINLLTKDKALKEAELERQRFAKNALTGGVVAIFVIAIIIFRNYRAKVRINKILDHQKDQIEHLLLNILPVEVARELQDSGHATPRNYESVSVLFTDFKGFTSLADRISPRELVDELNVCFMAFDDIIEKFKLEKIKTIGDSYMCAGGIPTPDPDHVFNIIRAGLEIQQYVVQNNIRREEKGLPPWDVRVGVHVGPLVAGVVGKKKYAYDIWGSTVNIASRMESNGEPGQVNISAATYELVKEKYNCRYRGKIYAKNVGEIDMYFIDNEKTAESIPVDARTEVLLPESKAVPERDPQAINVDTLYG